MRFTSYAKYKYDNSVINSQQIYLLLPVVRLCCSDCGQSWDVLIHRNRVCLMGRDYKVFHLVHVHGFVWFSVGAHLFVLLGSNPATTATEQQKTTNIIHHFKNERNLTNQMNVMTHSRKRLVLPLAENQDKQKNDKGQRDVHFCSWTWKLRPTDGKYILAVKLVNESICQVILSILTEHEHSLLLMVDIF